MAVPPDMGIRQLRVRKNFACWGRNLLGVQRRRLTCDIRGRDPVGERGLFEAGDEAQLAD